MTADGGTPMAAEEKLRDLLRSEATTIVPGGDGLARIRARIERRRRVRLWLVPSAAIATAGVAAAFFLFVPDDARHTQTLQPGATPTVTATGEPTASTSPVPVVPDDGGTPLDVAAIWPFSTQAGASSWSTNYPWAQDGLAVGRHFVADYLGLKDVNVSQHCVSCGMLSLDVGGKSVGQLTLARLGVGFASGYGTQVYTVVAVDGTDLTVTSPKAGAQIASPTSVTGRITGVDEHVDLRLLNEAGEELAHGGAQAGSAVPWSTTLSWSRTDWTTGAIVGVTRSMKDGSVSRIVAVPVTRATASPTASFAALVDGHVSLYDGTSGALVRQLTYPSSGKRDVDLAYSAGSLVWIRSAGVSVCVTEIDRLEKGVASRVTSSTSKWFSMVRLSADGHWLGWVEVACAPGGTGHLVVTHDGATVHRFPLSARDVAGLNAVGDDGTLLVTTDVGRTDGKAVHGLLRPTADTLAAVLPLAADSGCELADGDFEGAVPAAFETCHGTIRLLTFDTSGHRASTGPAVRADAPNSTAFRDGVLLVWLSKGVGGGAITRYAGDRLTTVLSDVSCTGSPAPTASGPCVSSPDW